MYYNNKLEVSMYKISKSIFSRISNGIKVFQPILRSANMRDVNESDTVTIIVDMLSEIFGYNKYQEITKEFQIRGTYCDLATLIDGKVGILIEVKAIGIDLKEQHTKQAIDYASNEGIDWVVLTNGIIWNVYKVEFAKPISSELIYTINFLELNPKKTSDIELLYPLSREGSVKSSLEIYHDQRQALSKFYLGALLLSESYLNIIKRDLKKLSPGIKIENAEIADVLKDELFKREIPESEQIKVASKKISRIFAKKTTAKESIQKPSIKNAVETKNANA